MADCWNVLYTLYLIVVFYNICDLSIYFYVVFIKETKKKQQTSREVRNENRRIQTAIAHLQENLEMDCSDLLKFNQLKVRSWLYIPFFIIYKSTLKIIWYTFYPPSVKVSSQIFLFTGRKC